MSCRPPRGYPHGLPVLKVALVEIPFAALTIVSILHYSHITIFLTYNLETSSALRSQARDCETVVQRQ